MPQQIEQRTRRKVMPGRDYPLGATVVDGGVNFVLASDAAQEVFLLLFDRPDGDPTDVIRLEERSRRRWHAFLPGLRPGQLYAYKVRGDYDPARGLRFNEHKTLIDPYAKALAGKLSNPENLLLAYDPGSPLRDLSFDTRDSTRVVPKSVVVDDAFDWRGDRPPEVPFDQLVVYEVHLKGFTAHRSSRVSRPGTYLGFIERIPHLKELGVTAVELLPVHEAYSEDFLAQKGLSNYWGYNTVGFFAPESSFASSSAPGAQVADFKTLVRELHRAGIEVLLDVVYNHSAEGNELGPTFSFKGVDNPTYYCLTGGPDDPLRYYMNYTGCGNSLNLANPHVIRFVMDSLRYWAETMHVDGFRFDLASVLGREQGWFDRSASFFDAVSQDPVLSRVKLIAEPWDLGSYQVGNFPVDWSEWNGQFRDTMRRFAKGDGGQAKAMGFRLTGSADLYGDDGRSPYNSVNFITCHDGFTLCDLVSYNGKHNEANLEENRDGANDNLSWNCGVEGETDDPAVLRLRRQIARNHVCHLLFSLGTPMLLGGDEMLRTQRGNNNAYCQDNEISWIDWDEAKRNRDFLEFVRKAIAMRRRHPILCRSKFHLGLDRDHDQIADITWFGPDGGPPRWDDPELRTLCYRLDCTEDSPDPDTCLLFFVLNGDPSMQGIRLPPPPPGTRWYRVIDTSLPAGEDFADPGREVLIDPADSYLANGRSTVVLAAR